MKIIKVAIPKVVLPKGIIDSAKSIQKFGEVLGESTGSFAEAINKIQDSLDAFNNKIRAFQAFYIDTKNKNKPDYQDIRKSYIHHFKKEGMVIPPNYETFFVWHFWKQALRYEETGEPFEPIKPRHFMQYHQEAVNLLIESEDSPGIKTFPKYLLHAKREQLAEGLKEEFTEKGKGIKLMIEVIERNDPPLLATKDRTGKPTYEAIKDYFGWNIGTYESVIRYRFDMVTHKLDFESAKTKLDYILRSLKD